MVGLVKDRLLPTSRIFLRRLFPQSRTNSQFEVSIGIAVPFPSSRHSRRSRNIPAIACGGSTAAGVQAAENASEGLVKRNVGSLRRLTLPRRFLLVPPLAAYSTPRSNSARSISEHAGCAPRFQSLEVHSRCIRCQ